MTSYSNSPRGAYSRYQPNVRIDEEEESEKRRKELLMLFDLSVKEKQKGNIFKSLQFLEEYLYTFMKGRGDLILVDNLQEELQSLQTITEKFVVKCNVVAMEFLYNDKRNLNSCKMCLQKAKNFVEIYGHIIFRDEDDKRAKLVVSTLNNFSVYFKECGELDLAMESLEMARREEKHFNASLELNFCAVLSQMGRHEEALDHALEALRQLEIFKKLNHIKNNVASCNETLIVAFYNVAVEYEHLRQTLASIEFYSQGLDLALETLGSDHPTTIRFNDSIEKVKMKHLEEIQATPPKISPTLDSSFSSSGRNSVKTAQSDVSGLRRFRSDVRSSIDPLVEKRKNRIGYRTTEVKSPANNSPIVIPRQISTAKSLPPNIPNSTPNGSTNGSFKRSYKAHQQSQSPIVNTPSKPLTQTNLELHNKMSQLQHHATQIQRVFKGYITRKKLKNAKALKASYKPIKNFNLESYIYNLNSNYEKSKTGRNLKKKEPVDSVNILKDTQAKNKQLMNDISSLMQKLSSVLQED